MPVRIGDPRCVAKTWPDYFEALFSVASAVPGEIPALTIDGPTASGKGTLASAVAAELGYVLLDSGAVYRAVAIAALQAGVEAYDEAALEALARSMDLRFAPAAPSSPAPTSAIRSASRPSARSPRASRPVRAFARPSSASRPRSGACLAWSPTAATWARSSSPTPPQGLPHRERRGTCRAKAQAVDFKGYFR
jgi:hypothetical protein